MRKLSWFVFFLILGISMLGVVSPTTIEKMIPLGNETVKVIVSVGDVVPMADGRTAEVLSFRQGQHVTIRYVGGMVTTVQLSAISLRTWYLSRRKKERKSQAD